MNPWLKPRGLSLPLRTDLIASRSTTGRNNRHHDRCPLEAGLTFLHGKAICCQNPYVTVQVQTVAPRFQGVPKQRTSILEAALLRLSRRMRRQGSITEDRQPAAGKE